jgi:hypothetical protein
VDGFTQPFLLLLALMVVLALVLRLRSRPRRMQDRSRHARARPSGAAAHRRASEENTSQRGLSEARHSPANAAPAIEPRPPLPALVELNLVRSAHLGEEAAQQRALTVEGLKQPHPLLSRITSGLDDPDELGRIVRADPGLSAEVLRTVNSAAFALSTPITSVNHALTFLGSTVVRSVVMHATVAPSLELQNDAQRLAVDRIWRASYIASVIAQLSAAELGLPRPSVLATEALLSSLGDIALLAHYPDLAVPYLEQSTLLEQVQAQQSASGLNAAVVAAALAAAWELPGELEQSLDNLLVPLVSRVDELPMLGEERRQLLVSYTACRLGWWLVSRSVDDIAEVDLAALEAPEFHYLPEHLQAAALGPLFSLPQQPGFRNKVNHLLAKLVNAPGSDQ